MHLGALMAKSYLFCITLCSLILLHGCVAQIEQQPSWQGSQQQPQSQRRSASRIQSECRIQSLRAMEPSSRFESEAGVTEHWDENEQQFECAGVAVTRHVIEPRGLLLPEYTNAPKLTYVLQGRGINGAIVPGCPETFQSFQQSSQGQSQGRYRDQHQKIRNLRQGDIVALPTGVAHWFYNDGESPLVLVSLLDTSNNQNQLDQNARRFYLAGNPQQQQSQGSYQGSRQAEKENSSNNILSGFDAEVLAEAFGVSTETARKLQSQNDKRGNIVRVENGLRVIRPPRIEEEEQREQQQQRGSNGFEETLCSARLVHNIADPERADVYTPNGGRINNLNSQKLPILNFLQLSAERGVLYRNAIMAPHWNLNAHSIIYVTRGSAKIQVVGNYKQPVFDGELREGQVLTVPQNFAVVKQAGSEGFEWVSFKTNDNAMISPLVGRISTLRAMPEDVLMNSYRISREEARRLKNNREEMVVFEPRSESQGRALA